MVRLQELLSSVCRERKLRLLVNAARFIVMRDSGFANVYIATG